jgi:cilia- and flagella-associated protein 65
MFGIDCCDSLCFRPGTWKPGGEYKKKLTIKNLSTKVIKVKYELPETKFFSMDFPEVITLSPGVHVPLEIVFRPIVYEEYYDFVTFKTENGKFKISVSAQVAKMCMDFPKSIEFNNCPVNEILEKKIVLHNTGQVPSDFEFSCESPFDISPSVGSIKAGKTQTLTCTFSPVKASVWTTRAVCKINNGEQIKICEISGTGKYPFLSFADRTSCRVEFGDVLVGSPKEKCQKTIRLENRSEIAGSFVTRHVESDVKPRFEIRPNRGVVLPNSFVDVVVTYLPVSTGMFLISFLFYF